LISCDIQVYVFFILSRSTNLCSPLVLIYILAFAYYLTGFQFDYVFDWTILKYQQSQIGGAPSRTLVYSTICYSLLLPLRIIVQYMFPG
jgi:hypothetical protein